MASKRKGIRHKLIQKLGIFYCYFNPIFQPIFLLFFMLEPATVLDIYFKPVTLKQTTEIK